MNMLHPLRCPACDWQRTFGPMEIMEALRERGMLRREAKPSAQTLSELLRAVMPHLQCQNCGQTGLELGQLQDEGAGWLEARACEVCRQPIPPERLEVFPQATRCAPCQDAPAEDTRQFCPHCGGLMQVRGRHAGIARYALVCTDCGRS